MSNLNELSASEAAKAIAAGEITSEALTAACLDRIKEREPDVVAARVTRLRRLALCMGCPSVLRTS
jgi:Asp-tRNA(Asn)/Glu-tRNA(Gln) amidotransferase A subunit family amidase